jgi:hypothetical protein
MKQKVKRPTDEGRTSVEGQRTRKEHEENGSEGEQGHATLKKVSCHSFKKHEKDIVKAKNTLQASSIKG